MNRFCYRMPQSEKVEGGKSSRLLEGVVPGGFAIYPFDGNQERVFTIPADEPYSILDDSEYEVGSGEEAKYPMPRISSQNSLHASSVAAIKDAIAQGDLSKCVLARVHVIDGTPDLALMFRNLCEAYPHAFVFFFDSPQTGAWIGASPELLLESRAGRVRTMALAGTRPAGSVGAWDSKNIEEQRIVLEWIEQALAEQGYSFQAGETETSQAGPVEHLRTTIEAWKEDSAVADDVQLAMRLSPTPALCGQPAGQAAKLISALEDFPRGYYGGFIGPVDETGFSFFVNLRSMRVAKGGCAMFAGGGITDGSIAKVEWLETERKLSTLKQITNLK